MAIKRIGQILVTAGIITEDELQQALTKQTKGERIGEALIRLGMTTETQILKALEDTTGVQRISLSGITIEENLLSLVDEEFCRRHVIVPLRIEENKLIFATSDPLDFNVVEELRLATGYRPKAYSAPKNDILTQIEKYYGFKKTLEGLGISKTVQEEIDEEDEIREDNIDDTPMVKLVNQILTSAVFQRASDIHIDPQDDKVIVRYRIDGVLETVREFPIRIHRQMISRIKVMSGMNITETRIPQDGRIQTVIQDRQFDLRISTLPTVRGEKVVMRILDMSGNVNRLNSIGLTDKEEKVVREMISQPNGIVLVSGPTGSGKTTTLYACLYELNRPNVNIITVEDPVEIKLTGVNQVQVQSEVNMTFASALRSILRQDPNVIMVGEIRDVETAEIAIRASLTGHLVLSTIHTNNAIKTITRLIDMNIEPFLIASSLGGVISQRLVRRLCKECSYEDHIDANEREMFSKFYTNVHKIKRAKGCTACNYRGYIGRVGVFEVLPITKPMQRLIAKNAGIEEIEAQAHKDGMVTLMESGLKKVLDGVTTVEEVMKVANE